MIVFQADLFQSRSLLDGLPDETLFSLISRHHHFWGHSIAARTSELLFGHTRAGSHHDFPNRLQSFVDRTHGCYGDVASIARSQTLLRFYLPFLPPSEIDNAVDCIAGNSVAHLKLRLGILTSRFRANHPLKACSLCMESDLRETGGAYWHLSHQYPGVWMCLQHAEPLLESNLKATGVQRFQWLLPSAGGLQSIDNAPPDEWDRDTRLGLAQLVTDVVANAPPSSFHAISLHEIFRAEIRLRGWMTPGGNLRMPPIIASLMDYLRPIRGVTEFAGFPQTEADARLHLGRMLRPPRSSTHPLRHLVTMHWLFGNWAAFEAARRAVASSPMGNTPAVLYDPACVPVDLRKTELRRLVQDRGLSFSAAAQQLNIDIATAMAWATKDGIAMPRRPKKLTEVVRAKAIRQLRRGADKAVVAASAQVSIETITRLLLTEVGLHVAWIQARDDRARSRARKAWTERMTTDGHLGVKLLRKLDPTTYTWLYRHDRVWLNAHRPAPLVVSAYPRASAVDWSARDAKLSQSVREAALALRRKGACGRIFLWQLYQQLPQLKAKAHALAKLPLTQRALTQALQSTPISDGDLFA